jgi:ABC-type phosphate transport system substrate-binding protein
MKQSKFLSAALLAAAVAIAAPPAHAVTVEVLGAGSSAIWQTAALGAFAEAGAGAFHYTIKGSTACTVLNPNCAVLHDQRSGQILPEPGNLWFVWNAAGTKVWADLSVDSIVGNRAYFATPRNQLQVDPATETGSATCCVSPANAINSALWVANSTNPDQPSLPTAIYNALNNATVTAGFTDIRPEDAKFASCRVLNALNTANYSGLGYGTGTTCATLIGTQIWSNVPSSTAVANPVNFNIKGKDPFTEDTIKASTTLSVGASPIVFIVNRKNTSGLGYPALGSASITNLTIQEAQQIWNGTECDTNSFAGGPGTAVPITAWQREPMSGTMNTTEFTTFRCGNTAGTGCPVTGPGAFTNSQEKGIVPPAQGAFNFGATGPDPLNLPCATVDGIAGTRQRAVGTGDMVNGVNGQTDSIGYIFWGFGNVSKISNTNNYGYLTLSGGDPIQTTYDTGVLPACANPCPATPGASFPNLRNGTYKAWSLLRVVTDASGANLTQVKELVAAIEANINTSVPDFVPYAAGNGDPGLKLYRSHYLQSSVAPNNGLSSEKEAGGDMGGCIENVGPAPGILSCHQ